MEVRLPDLLAQARDGRPSAIGRLLSLVEDESTARAVARALDADTGPLPDGPLRPHADGVGAHVIGITGPPGAGKSTVVSAAVAVLRRRGARVAVLAVDPSSPETGGALLGDRVRMRAHALDPGVFIRSMSARGRMGGLSHAAPLAVRVLSAAGFGVVLLETVGVGQSEVDVTETVDTVVVISAPGMGDELQAMKAGLLEVADIYVVNKADLPGASGLVRQLRRTAALSRPSAPGAWRRPVTSTVAIDGQVDELVEAVDQHLIHLCRSGELAERRMQRTRSAVRAQALAAFVSWLDGPVGRSALGSRADEVQQGRCDDWSAADSVLRQFTHEPPA